MKKIIGIVLVVAAAVVLSAQWSDFAPQTASSNLSTMANSKVNWQTSTAACTDKYGTVGKDICADTVTGIVYHVTVTSTSGSFATWAPVGLSCMPSQTQTVSAVSSITFSSIPATCTNLVVNYTLMGGAGGPGDLVMRINADSGTHYDYNNFYFGSAQPTPPVFNSGQTSALIGPLTNNSVALQGASVTAVLHDYATGTLVKNFTAYGYRRDTGPGGYVFLYGGDWESAAAVTTLTFTPSFGAALTGTITVSGN